jgi:proline dehydrogenase
MACILFEATSARVLLATRCFNAIVWYKEQRHLLQTRLRGVGMLRTLINPILPLVPRFLIDRVAQPYVAGASLDEALESVRANEAQGFSSTLAVLGEELRDEGEVEDAVQEYCATLQSLHADDLPCGLSIKATHVGLRISREVALASFQRIAEAAKPGNTFIRLDMEDSTTTADILWLYRRLRESYARCGIVLQAMLRRTELDIHEILTLPDPPDVRICKGIYAEPGSRAYLNPDQVRQNFVRSVMVLLERGANVGVATHDGAVIHELFSRMPGIQNADGRYELQTLLGVPIQGVMQALRAQGHRVRVYIPYGPDWYAYSMRRLKENPKIMGYVINNIFKSK